MTSRRSSFPVAALAALIVVCLPALSGAQARGAATPVLSADARQAYFDRWLQPVPVAPPVDKDAKKVAEAAALYERGLAFAAQGAWVDAQKNFRDAEKKFDHYEPYVMASAYGSLKIHKASDAEKRYQDIYKQTPTHQRALLGLIAAHEDIQYYRDALELWLRYATLPLAPADAAEVRGLIAGARQLFAERYEIEENPAGGAKNLASAKDELEIGLSYAKKLGESGVELVTDREVVSYVEQLCKTLVANSKNFPSNYKLYVLDTATVNATTTPGFIFVYRGILEVSDTEAALAGVLAHEIGHSVGHHIGKAVTKGYEDQQQIEALKKSNSKLSQFLASMLTLGSGLGQQQFSRENEAQADRLAVHIAYDSGFDPDAIADLFQKFEQMAPTSRASWDLLVRSHPPSIDRINAVKAYAALLPEKKVVTSSPAFDRMKKRLAQLPPPPDATGQLLNDTSRPAAPPATPPPATPPSRTGGAPPATRTPPAAPKPPASKIPNVPMDRYTLSPVPFSGTMPKSWTILRRTSTVYFFQAPTGTPGAEVANWLEVTPRVSHAGRSLDDMVALIRQNNSRVQDITFDNPQASTSVDGRPSRILPATFTGRTTAGVTTNFQAIWLFAEYPDYYVIAHFAAPADFFESLMVHFQVIWSGIKSGLVPASATIVSPKAAPAAPAPAPAPPAAPPRANPPATPPSTPPAAPPAAPKPASGRTPFSVKVAPFDGEIPADWQWREESGRVIIEGQKGTEAYAMTINLLFWAEAGNSLNGIANQIQDAFSKLNQARLEPLEGNTTDAGRPVKGLTVEYVNEANGQRTAFKQMGVVVKYDHYFVALFLVGPEALFDKYFPVFNMVGTLLKERGVAGASPK